MNAPKLVSVPYGDSEELLRSRCEADLERYARRLVSVPYGDSEELLLARCSAARSRVTLGFSPLRGFRGIVTLCWLRIRVVDLVDRSREVSVPYGDSEELLPFFPLSDSSVWPRN
jgi:hypothetical protein